MWGAKRKIQSRSSLHPVLYFVHLIWAGVFFVFAGRDIIHIRGPVKNDNENENFIVIRLLNILYKSKNFAETPNIGFWYSLWENVLRRGNLLKVLAVTHNYMFTRCNAKEEDERFILQVTQFFFSISLIEINQNKTISFLFLRLQI